MRVTLGQHQHYQHLLSWWMDLCMGDGMVYTRVIYKPEEEQQSLFFRASWQTRLETKPVKTKLASQLSQLSPELAQYLQLAQQCALLEMHAVKQKRNSSPVKSSSSSSSSSSSRLSFSVRRRYELQESGREKLHRTNVSSSIIEPESLSLYFSSQDPCTG